MTDKDASSDLSTAYDGSDHFAPINRALLQYALSIDPDAHSSDYDLNPEVRAKLPAQRALSPAAVLCPLVEREAGLHLILTRRAEHLKHHSGQVAFPGGRLDPTDASLEAAALREADEEIGLRAEQVEIAGRFGGHETVTGYQVTPFLGFVDPTYRPVPDPGEVAEVFEVPFDFVMNPINHQKRSREWQGSTRYYWAMPYNDYFIWGATARMLVGLSVRVALARKSFSG